MRAACCGILYCDEFGLTWYGFVAISGCVLGIWLGGLLSGWMRGTRIIHARILTLIVSSFWLDVEMMIEEVQLQYMCGTNSIKLESLILAQNERWRQA